MTHVLIVDDEKEILELAQHRLEREGYTVTTATTEEDGTRLAKAIDDLDLVLTDLRIGEGSGLKLCESVISGRPDIPVVVMTGYSTIDGRTLYQFWLNSVRRYEHWIPNANFNRTRHDADYSHHMLTVETQMRLYDNKPWYYNNKMLEFLLKKP